MGGYDQVNTVETLDPAVGSWVSHRIPEAPSGETWICSVGHKILVLELQKDRFRSFDVSRRIWTRLRFLPHHREGFTVAGSGNHFYVLGGVEPHGTRCDRYNARTDQWEEMSPTQEGRKYAASVCHADRVYCSGGGSVPGDLLLSSMEVLDPRVNGQWNSLPPMEVRRLHHCLVSCDRFLWAIGGTDDETCLSDVERYDVEGQHWSLVRALPLSKENLSGSVIGGRIHIIGGWTTIHKNVPSVEVYDEEKDEWASAGSLQKGRFSHGSCVVSSLSVADADQYAVSIGTAPATVGPPRI